MLKPTPVILAALLAASFTAGCNKEKTPAAAPGAGASAQATAGEPAPDTVVATFGTGEKITYKELNEKISDRLSELEKQKHQLRKRSLEGMVTEKLVDAEAKKRNMTQEQYLKAEIEDKVPAPPEERIKEVFEGAKGQLPPGSTYEQMKPQIVDFLTQQPKQERAQALFAELRKNANVQITLPEPPRPPAERKQVAATGPSKGGGEGAPVTIVEFSDFQCPFCSRANASVDQVMKEYGDKVRLVFRHFPLDFHKEAQKASEASLCAHDQGKFWEMHDTLFANQQQLGVEDLKKHAAALKLDTAKFNQCLDSGEKAQIVKNDMADGQKVGVNGTPAFFINGILISGAQPFEEFKSIIDEELKTAKK